MAGSDLFTGSLDLLLLKALSWGPMHGLGVVRWIETVTRQRLQVEEGALYPALHRLERKRWISASWSTSENKQRVRVYTLTAKGRKQLERERSQWEQLSRAIGALLAAPARRES